MVGAQHGRLHAGRPQPGTDAFDKHVQRIADAQVFGKKADAFGAPGRGIDAAQAQPGGGRQHGRARQPLGQQVAQVFHALRGLGGTDDERLRGRQRAAVQALQVQRPFQLEGQHALLARAQPQLQRCQQPVGRPQQRRRVFDPRGQFQRLVEPIGQREPGVALGRQAPGDVERAAQLGPEAPHHRRARQGIHLAPGAQAEPRQQGQVRARGAERGQRQRGGPLGGHRLVLHALAQHRQSYDSNSCLRFNNGRWRRI